ncbi:MAG: Calx-beta domain-containing protein [Pseudomonadota bacterium]
MASILDWWSGVLAPFLDRTPTDGVYGTAATTEGSVETASLENEQQLAEIHGTALDDDLIGTGADEALYGHEGDDRLYALGGDDFLYGGDGDDLLDGGEGADFMSGGSGSDIYRVDHAGDVVSEESVPGTDDGGTDYVVSTISWTLGAHFEKLELRGASDIDGAGNGLNNNVKGNDGANILFGGGGSDILYGYAGDDVLIGGDGKDYFFGGPGADTFVLKPEPGAWNKIYDFEDGDRIGVYAGQYGLSEGDGLTGGVLDASRFAAGTAPTAAHGQFLFTGSTLLWDPDGTGAQKSMTLALFGQTVPLSAADIVAYGAGADVSVLAANATPATETDAAAHFALRLSHALDEDAVVTVSTVDGEAAGGADFEALSSQEVLIKAGSTTVYVPVALLDDDFDEGSEDFALRIDGARRAETGEAIAIGTASTSVVIEDEGPAVVGDVFTAAWGSTDPSGIVFDPVTSTLLLTDSEVEEEPFLRADNMFRVTLDGEFVESLSLPYSDEATGLALDEATGRLFVSDDDAYKIFCVDASDPTTVLWEFDTDPLGAFDPEDVAIDASTGNLFICNGDQRTIVEVNQTGTQVFSSILLPEEIADPEAIAFNADEQLFYVGGGFSADIWKVDRTGAIVDVLTVLRDARAPETNHRVNVKDLAFAPASDGSDETSLYVADYGWSHFDDGRLIEIDLGDQKTAPEAGWLLG